MVRIERRCIPDLTVKVLRAGKGSRPDVRLLDDGVHRLVCKDFAQGNLTMRLLGLFLISRERDAYQRLTDLPGIPKWYGQIDAWCMLTEYIEAQQVSIVPVEQLTPEFFTKLRNLIEAVHRRGVAHGDLKRLDNILITPAGDPVLIDFSAAFWNGSNPLAALVFPYLFDDDLRAVYKLKYRRAPHLLTEEEEHFLNLRPPAERFFRRFREYFRRPVQRLAGSELNE